LGGQIVFMDDRSASKHSQIYIENADGTRARHLVTSDFDDQKPALSPDGLRVVFTRYAPDGAPALESGVFVVNVDGTELIRLSDGEDVSWSPDGRRIAFSRLTHGSNLLNVGLWVVNADGTAPHQVTMKGVKCPNVCAGGAQDNEPVWSADGTHLAFLRDEYTSPEQFVIFTVALDGTDLRQVTPNGMEVGNPAWSPVGDWIAFQSPKETVKSGEQNIYKVRPDGTGLTQLTAKLSSASWGQGTFHPWWSPDGSEIVFSHGPGSMPDRASLYVMNADGSGLRLIAPSSLNQNFPVWGPIPGG
jgi:Tol biopolymer transport system component